MAIANYEDRFVIPTAHREWSEDAQDLRGSCGFSFGNGCSGGTSETNLFGTKQTKKRQEPDGDRLMKSATRTFKALSALLMYPTDELVAAMPDIEAAMVTEGLLKHNARQALLPLIGELQTLDLYDLQERYVDLFDKTRAALSAPVRAHPRREPRPGPSHGRPCCALRTWRTRRDGE